MTLKSDSEDDQYNSEDNFSESDSKYSKESSENNAILPEYIKVASVSDNIKRKAAFSTLFPQFLRYQIENMKNAFFIFKSFDDSFSSALQFDTIAARDI